MPPFQSGDMAFSRHDNSFKLLGRLIVTKNSRLVDLSLALCRKARAKFAVIG
jgi:hypothetical protein